MQGSQLDRPNHSVTAQAQTFSADVATCVRLRSIAIVSQPRNIMKFFILGHPIVSTIECGTTLHYLSAALHE